MGTEREILHVKKFEWISQNELWNFFVDSCVYIFLMMNHSYAAGGVVGMWGRKKCVHWVCFHSRSTRYKGILCGEAESSGKFSILREQITQKIGREQARQQGVINVRTHKCKIFTLSDDVLRHLSSQAMTFWLFSLFTLLLIHEAHKLFAQFVSNLFHSRVLCCYGRPAHIDSISEERAT